MRNFIDKLYQRFQKDQHGAILPIFGILVIFLVVIGGSAIDVSRVVNAREKLSYAIDAAALSVAVDLSGKLMSDGDIKIALEDSFRANLDTTDWRDLAINNIAFQVDSEEGTVTVSSTAHLNNYFIDMGGYGIDQFGPETFAFGSSAKVKYSRFNLELAMVLDVTGSMDPQIQGLKNAAESVVNILIPDDATPSSSKVRISMVPYSFGVNLGPYANQISYGDAKSDNCLTERTTDKFTDVSYNSFESSWNKFRGTADTRTRDGGDVKELPSGPKWRCSSSELVPLTSNKSLITGEIDKLQTRGGTAGHTGIMWGWYTLAPNWNNVWPYQSAAADYPEGTERDKTKKVAIIMTDGAFNTYYENIKTADGGCKYKYVKGKLTGLDCWQPTFENRMYETYVTNSYDAGSNTRALRYCEEMKNNNIEIFTVYFQVGGLSSLAERIMKECANEDNYHKADNTDQLETVFENIAKKIQKIYLSG